MKTLEYRFEDVDKTEWGEGPWLNEPDKVQWQDETTGLPCIAKRNPMGAWCGYVGVPEGHPAYDKGYDDEALEGIAVHGGLTYSEFCRPHDDTEQGEAHAICHVVEDGEDDRAFWHGFDCAHAGDLQPRLSALTGMAFDGDTYKPLGYVKEEVGALAEQLAAMP